ncbi:MAG: primosomal protein N', partial [Bacilli bacterium]
GIYGFLELKTRVNNHQLPQVKIVDMKESMRQGYRILSKELITAIKDKLNKKEQIMILLNRRGYSNYLNCQSCGHTFKCPACDITMTYHKTSDMMRCHYCGYATKKIDVCPECKTKSLRSIGFGTEKLEEELKKLFEDAKIIRMDLDTTTQKGSHSKIINAFSNREYDILLGTQMIAKGLDFDNVSLVGVINADNSLDIPDFRSGEKTFQLLSQVAGRSGRTSLKGEVILQVFNSDHYVISTVKEHNYEAFYRQEIIMRKKLNYPPFCFIASIKIISKEYEKGFKLSKEISDFLKKELPNNTVLGPTMANIFKINNYYRYNCLIKYKNKEEVLETLKKVQNHYQTNQNFKIEFDFNPIHF